MRAAISIESFRPGPGGVEGAAFALANELGKRGVDLTVLCREAASRGAPAGVRVELLGGPNFWQPLRVVEFSRRAARAAAAGGFDVVQGFSRSRHQDVYRAGGGSHAAYMARVYPRPALRRLSPRHTALLAIEGAVFRDPRQVVLCNSRFVAGEVARLHGVPAERLEVIYNGVDLERFHPARRGVLGPALRRALGLADGERVCVAIGSGFARKGFDLLLRLWREAPPRDTALVLVGDDERLGHYRGLAQALGGSVRASCTRFFTRRRRPT